MNSKTLSSRARFVCAAVAVAALPSTVSAQQFDVQQFRPAASQTTNAFTVHSAEILTNGEWELGLVLNYANDPLIVRRSDTQTLRFGDVVSEQLALDILGAVGIARFLEIGFDIPLILVQTGDRVDGVDGATGAQGGFGVGTVRVVPAITFFDRSRDGGAGPALGIVADLLLPTGSEEDWQGEGFRANPQLAFDYALSSGLRLSLNAGAMFRPQSDLLSNLNVGNQFTWGVAVDAPVALDDALRVIGEVHGAAGLTADDLAVEELPTELLLGVRYVSEAGAAVEAGGGTGLIGGAGSPDFRLFVGVGYAGGADPDRDDDGFPNSEDACPLEAEDFDEYRDGDGCPDVDNDEDGIRDTIDECPLDPEDKDDFEDLDGCPDPDNDGDGIID
ncbi:MAG: transporter, partial [Myxococcales bacterium]|nr:transporter [Myxococcales bacterium]